MVGKDQAWQAAAAPSNSRRGATKSMGDRRPGHCPKGHKLSRWIARRGTCDGCSRIVDHGERVMDCRSCNWYLCGKCFLRPRDDGLWGAFTYLADMAAQDASELASDLSTFAYCSAPVKANLVSEELEVGQEVDPFPSAIHVEQPTAGGYRPGPQEVVPRPSNGVMEGEAMVERPAVTDPFDPLDVSEDLLGLTDPAPRLAPAMVAQPVKILPPPAGRPVIPASPAGRPVIPALPLNAMLFDLGTTTTATAALPHVPVSYGN